MKPLSNLTGALFLLITGSSSYSRAPFPASILPNPTPVDKRTQNGTASAGDFLLNDSRPVEKETPLSNCFAQVGIATEC